MREDGYPFYIVLAAHGDARCLQDTLRSLAACLLPKNYRELILVENGTKSGIENVASRADERLRVRYLYNPRPSKSEALNVALGCITDFEAFIFFTDDDVDVTPEILEIYDRSAKINGPGHYFGGPVVPNWEVPPPGWLLPCLPGSAKGWRLQPGALLYAFLGFNWGAFLSDLRAAGPFDGRFGPGSDHGATGQETNMHVRMFRKGFVPVYLEHARVTHQVPKSKCNFYWVVCRSFRSGVSAGLSGIPFHPGSVTMQDASKTDVPVKLPNLFQKAFRLLRRVKSLAELMCSMTCLLAVHAGTIKGIFIRRFGIQNRPGP